MIVHRLLFFIGRQNLTILKISVTLRG